VRDGIEDILDARRFLQVRGFFYARYVVRYSKERLSC